jgi:hypothetical protein
MTAKSEQLKKVVYGIPPPTVEHPWLCDAGIDFDAFGCRDESAVDHAVYDHSRMALQI